MTKHWRRVWLQRLVVGLLVVTLGLTGCSDRPFSQRPTKLSRTPSKRFVKEIVEVPPPESIQKLRSELEVYQPQVQILSPQPEAVLDDTRVEVQLDVKDLPLFKDEALGLGSHLHLILDNQPYQAVYDTSTPIVFDDLEPGTHTLRVFASRPWHESFKNAGAYDQIKFYVFTDTPNNAADLQAPLITYSRPKGQYGAEPIMLDFYLANTPLHVIAQEDPEDDLLDWQIRGTVNGQSFTFDTWEPIYLTGFEPGINWIKLELLDEEGSLMDNAFTSTARIITFQPGGDDSLSKLVRGELPNDQLFKIVDPDYIPAPVTEELNQEEVDPNIEPDAEVQPQPEPEAIEEPETQSSKTAPPEPESSNPESEPESETEAETKAAAETATDIEDEAAPETTAETTPEPQTQSTPSRDASGPTELDQETPSARSNPEASESDAGLSQHNKVSAPTAPQLQEGQSQPLTDEAPELQDSAASSLEPAPTVKPTAASTPAAPESSLDQPAQPEEESPAEGNDAADSAIAPQPEDL